MLRSCAGVVAVLGRIVLVALFNVGSNIATEKCVLKDAATQVGKRVIYVNIPDDLSSFEYFGDAYAKAIGWSFEEHISYSAGGYWEFLLIPVGLSGSQMGRAVQISDAQTTTPKPLSDKELHNTGPIIMENQQS
ncbi:hypothetical protein BC937DRAFT_95444 [Endogone sp. FLAS-F59071]|nr:hypothetical protein BC937DRAFT_95444 [Endogone sp. FLAS-F59071]|eukprot:RUS13351.1 hypothetical protein BC937DRAFT_95444 [Endogone sp. FLAS-F59071]